MKYKEQTMSSENNSSGHRLEYHRLLGSSSSSERPESSSCLHPADEENCSAEGVSSASLEAFSICSLSRPSHSPAPHSRRRPQRRAARATTSRAVRRLSLALQHVHPRAASVGSARGAGSGPRTGCPRGPVRDAGAASACTPPASTRLQTAKASYE